MAYCTIYKITNGITGKVYIGQTWQTLQARMHMHTSNSKGSKCTKLKNSIGKYGKEVFTAQLLTVAHTQECADYWEIYFINKYDSIVNGYNLLTGGSRGKHTPETLEKLRVSHLGHKASEETKRKQSLASLGRKMPPDSVKASAEKRRGAKRTDEARHRISEGNKGKHVGNLNAGKKFIGKTWKLINGKRVWLEKVG